MDTTLDLVRGLTEVINRASRENESNTPDFLLGDWLEKVLAATEGLVKERDRWYGVALEPGGASRQLPPATVYVVTVHEPVDDLCAAEFVFSHDVQAAEAAKAWANSRRRLGSQVTEHGEDDKFLLVLTYSGPQDSACMVRVRPVRIDSAMEV